MTLKNYSANLCRMLSPRDHTAMILALFCEYNLVIVRHLERGLVSKNDVIKMFVPGDGVMTKSEPQILFTYLIWTLQITSNSAITTDLR